MTQEGQKLPEEVRAAADTVAMHWFGGTQPALSGQQYFQTRDATAYRNDSYPSRDLSRLSQRFAELCARAGLPRSTPFYVISNRNPKEPDLNTPAGSGVGPDGRPLIGITDRFLARLTDDQALAILAHELYHYQHMSAANSRADELAADTFSARITGHPEWLQGALLIARDHLRDEYYRYFAQTYPSGRDEEGRDVETAYRAAWQESQRENVHPTIEERLGALEAIKREMQQGRDGRSR